MQVETHILGMSVEERKAAVTGGSPARNRAGRADAVRRLAYDDLSIEQASARQTSRLISSPTNRRHACTLKLNTTILKLRFDI